MIESTSFGTMTIDGMTYTSDLILFPDGHVEADWWRSRGHQLLVDDILRLVEAEPDLIVVGSGTQGRMRPEANLASFLDQRGVGLIVASNARAVTAYNEARANGRRVGACFHLTC